MRMRNSLPHGDIATMERQVTGTWNDDPAHFRKPSRRGFLHVGMIGALGLSLDDFFRLRAGAAETKEAVKEPKAQSVIHIYLPGGMAHQDSFDPKPYAPIEYRGEVGITKTKLDGVFFCEFLKKTAEIADKITVVRSM